MAVRIEGGVTHINWGAYPYNFKYEYEDNDGIHTVLFTSETIPRLGDTIVNGVLVPHVGYIINNDPGFQAKRKGFDREYPYKDVR